MESADGKDLERALDYAGLFINDVEGRLQTKVTDTNLDETVKKYHEYFKKPEFSRVVVDSAAEACCVAEQTTEEDERDRGGVQESDYRPPEAAPGE